MLSPKDRFSASVLTSEDPFPLGPFPRCIWIHHNTPQDSLDKVCYEIWKRVQRLSAELQSPELVPLLQHVLCSDLPGTLRRDSFTSHATNYLLDEPEGLESIYRAVIGNKEREMKLRALCDAQLSAKPLLTSLRCSAKPHKNPKGLEDMSSMAGTGSTESSKLEVPLLLQHPDSAEDTEQQVVAEETQAGKEVSQTSTSSSTTSSTVGSSTAAADSQAAGQEQQLPPFGKTCSRTDSDAGSKALQNPVTTAGSDKRSVIYNASTSGFFTTSVTTAFNQPVWQSLSFPQFSIFPSNSNFPQFQGPYHQRPRILYQQALHPPFGCYSRQAAPYSPQQIFQPLYNPVLNYVALVQPGYPFQHRAPAALPSNIQDLAPVAGDGILHPCPPSYGFSSTPGAAVTTTLNFFSSDSYVKF